MATKIIIVGARGRMGEALLRLAGENSQLEVVAGVDKGDDLLSVIDKADVLIEFAHHSLSPGLAETAVKHKKALVVGTTGHTDGERKAVAAAGQKIPLVFAPNFSVGVNLLFYLTRIAAEKLGENFDQEVVEIHHRRKIDSPSGTARRLAEVLAEAAGGSYDELLEHGRHGDVGPRAKRKIGMHAVRGGDVVGDHTVIFAGDGERIELAHKASSRDTFAAGALRAAQWVRGQKAGLYTMQDVLGLN